MKELILMTVCFTYCSGINAQTATVTQNMKGISLPKSTSKCNNPIQSPAYSILGSTLPKDFYAKNLSFFCKKELELQKIHFPLSIRVGSLEQCNYMEQKPGYK